MMTAQQAIAFAQSAGLTVTATDGKLIVRGKRGETFDQVLAMIKPIKDEVVKALTPLIEPPQLFDIAFDDAEPAPHDSAAEQQQPRLHSRFAEYVGQVVSDDDMYELYYMAHRAGVALKSEPLGETLPCRHRVLSCRLLP